MIKQRDPQSRLRNPQIAASFFLKLDFCDYYHGNFALKFAHRLSVKVNKTKQFWILEIEKAKEVKFNFFTLR